MTTPEQRTARLRARLAATRSSLKAIDVTKPTHVPEAMVAVIGTQRAALIANGAAGSGGLQAMRNRAEIERMSLAGTPVAEIAVALGLSYSHVVAVRARLGVGRKR